VEASKFIFLHEIEKKVFDVGITYRVLIIAIPGADYGGGLAQRLHKLDPHVISTKEN
jgi:hypothetical protein